MRWPRVSQKKRMLKKIKSRMETIVVEREEQLRRQSWRLKMILGDVSGQQLQLQFRP